jgi:hypothetical protein
VLFVYLIISRSKKIVQIDRKTTIMMITFSFIMIIVIFDIILYTMNVQIDLRIEKSETY